MIEPVGTSHIGILPRDRRPGSTRARGPARLLAALALIMLVAGCGRVPFGSRDAATQPVAGGATTAVVGTDPVVAFAARAQPGASDRIALAGGQPAAVRVTRAYISGNGRECREVAVGSGMVERQRLVCATEAGWAEVRPLLRGGGTARP